MTKKDLLRKFSINAVMVFIGWVVLYYLILIPYTNINGMLTNAVLWGTNFGLNQFGYQASIENNLISIATQPAVIIQDGCNGLELFALYAGFLIAFPGKLKFKLAFIPVGVILIFVINVLRNIALSLNHRFFQETFEFNHKYTYVLIVYVFVFMIWRFWMNRYSILSEKA